VIAPVRLLLLDRTVHPLRYVARTWPLALAPTMVIATLASLVTHALGADYLFEGRQWDTLFDLSPTVMLLQVVVVAPVLETLVMWPMLALYVRLLRRRRWAVLASALTWALLHSLSTPIWGICIFWTFVVFSTAYLVWREVSLRHALGVTAAIHALNNAVAGLAIVLS
jgi:hypothetical protein